MSTFKTKDGTEFLVEVNMLTVKRVRQLLGVNVLDILGVGDQLGGYVTDDVKLMDVLCAVVRPQLERIGWSDDEFVRQFDQAVLTASTSALMDEVADFFQEPRKGLVKKAIAKARAMMAEMEKRQVAAAEAALSRLNYETLLETPMTPDSGLPESPALSRGRSRSESSTKWRRGGSTKTGRTRRT